MPGVRSYFVHTLLRARHWQPRPQFDEVCAWWRSGGQGVCSLIGIGGAGKTAIADRFLQTLPEVLPQNPDVPKDETLPLPESVFVFSFYDAPNPEAFFAALGEWLQTVVSTVTVAEINQSGRTSYHQIVMRLQDAPPSLLILDGLERIQEDGTRGGIFGRIAHGSLRDFVTRLSQGWFPHLSALITSRFSLADLDEVSPTHYQAIDVEEIDFATGIDLLRRRGVTGSNDQLASIVENCGQHALTVDMAGGFLWEFHKGNPTVSLEIGSPEEIEEAAKSEQDPKRRAALKQELRFAKVAARYRRALKKKDKAALALLERVCLFRLGTDAETLTRIFTGKGTQKVAGAALSRLNAERLQQKLDLLVRMGLLEATEVLLREGEAPAEPHAHRHSAARQEPRPPETRTSYTIHPAVRDGFLAGLDPDTKQNSHEAALKGLEVSLGDAPGENPSDPAMLDLLEEIVHHTLQSDHVREAWDIHRNRIGGFKNLGWRLGAYERGERICRAFAGGQSPESVVSLSREGGSRPDQAKRRSGNTESSPSQILPEHRLLPEHRRSAPRAGLLDGDSRLPTDGDAQDPDASTLRRMPFLDLPEATQAIFINAWAMYLKELGRLAAAARCFELHNEMRMRQEDWKNASSGNQNLCDVRLLSGRLSRLPQAEGGRTAAVGRRKEETDESLPPSSFVARPSEASPATSARLGASSAGALATADEALRLAERADDAEQRQKSYSYRGHARAQRGNVPSALADFHSGLDCQHKVESDKPSRPLYGNYGNFHTHLLARLGRREDATRRTKENQAICNERFGDTVWSRQSQLVLSSLSLDRSVSESSSSGSSADLWTQARDWALARDAKEVLCWSCLVEAQHALAPSFNAQPQAPASQESTEAQAVASGSALNEANTALESGLKIARDSGFGLYHIDLLLERARLHLLRGAARAALDDVEMALGDEEGGGGIPADEKTGQPELLAARNVECGYVWPVPIGLQLRAEALLLQAAQEIGDDSFVPAKLGKQSDEFRNLIDQAKENLAEAMTLWQPLHDPEPERPDQNFQLDRTLYNDRAKETHRILTDVEQGLLTRYPLTPHEDEEEQTHSTVKTDTEITTTKPPASPAEASSRMKVNPMTDSYIVFCRLVGLDGLANNQIAGAVAGLKQALDQALEQHCTGRYAGTSHSSVFGRFARCTLSVENAIEVARSVIEDTAKKGIHVAIGIAGGRLEEVRDVRDSNLAGHPINKAARLAFHRDETGWVACLAETAKHAQQANSDLANAFTEVRPGKVKRTEFEFCQLKLAPVSINGTPPSANAKSELAHIVAYDIEGYSDNERSDQVAFADGLAARVKRALESAGTDSQAEDKDWWYSPGGDGGIIVFGSERAGGPRAAWTFAKALIDHCRGHIPLRVGIASGQLVVMPDNLPVGHGIFEAEEASGIPAAGQLCGTTGFWNDSLDSPDRSGWTASECTNESLVLLSQQIESAAEVEDKDRKEKDVDYPGKIKVSFCKKLGSDWQKLADTLCIEEHDQSKWKQGEEPREIWQYLKNRTELGLLPGALREIGRGDLADELEANPS